VADTLAAVLTEAGYPPRRTVRAETVGLYYKDGGTVEELVGLMGSQHVVFEIINSRIERDIRNNENRATNCVAKNIEKSISAASRQIEAIGALIERGRLGQLSEGLQTTAMTRYRNPDATLDELVALHDPPISKSGLNHRLKKLLEAAEDLL
jgi:DNA-binding protein WhiA